MAVALGMAGSWAFVTQILEVNWYADPLTIILVVLGAMLLTIAIGTLATWSALSVRPARFLREE